MCPLPSEQKQLKGLMKLLDMLKEQLVRLNNQLHSLHEDIARWCRHEISAHRTMHLI